MKILIAFVSVLCCIANVVAQDVYRVVFTDTSRSLNLNPYFNKRFTPTAFEVERADSVMQSYIDKEMENHTDMQNYRSYFRQYVGYYNLKSEKILFVNALCRRIENWEKWLVEVQGGGACYFNAKVNLDKKACFDFVVNAPR